MNKMIFIVLLLVPIQLFSRTIQGLVIDENDDPIAYTNVIVLDKDDSFLEGVVTDSLGMFQIDNLSKDAVALKISSIGYNDTIINIEEVKDISAIKMKESSITLDEVVVKGDLPRTRLANDALITNIQNSVLANIGTANDVLCKIPLVAASDGIYSVFGRGEASIYINNRKIVNLSELAQLSSGDIKSVEVISNPGAKFSAETNAVIRIITRPPKGEGFSLSLYDRVKIAHFALNTGNVSIKYRQGGLEIFADGYFNGGKRKLHDIPSMTTYGENIFEQHINAYTVNTIADYNGTIGFNYQTSTNHSFGGFFEIGENRLKPTSSLESIIINDGLLYEKLNTRQIGSEMLKPTQEANIYYSGQLGNLIADFNAGYVYRKSNKYFEYFETDDNDNCQIVISEAYNQKQLFAEKLNLSYPLWKGLLEVGEEYTNSKVSYNSAYSGAEISGSDTEINENNISAFAELSQTFGKFKVGIGLRFEHAHYNYYEEGKLDNELSRTYDSWFPSFSVSTNIKNTGLSLNITSKTRRPSYYQLDGALQYINRYSYQSGNPSLKPVDIYSAQLMAQWRYFFAQAIYSYEKNSIIYTTQKYNDDPLVKIVRFVNCPKQHKYQIAIGAQPQFGIWSPQFMGGLLCSSYSTMFRNSEMKFNHPIMILNWDNTIVFPHKWIIDANFMVQSSGNAENCYLKSRSSFNIGIRKSFFNDTFIIQLQANDIFNMNNERIVMYNGDIKVSTENYQESRNIVFSLRYNFNTSRSKYKGSGAGLNEKSRL